MTQRNVVGMGDLGGSLNLSADGDVLILTSWFDGDARIWDPQAQQRLAHYPNLAGPVAAVRYAGGLAIAEHLKGSVTLYGEGDPIELASGLTAPTGLHVSGNALYVGDRDQGQILRIAESGEALDQPDIVTETGTVVIEADAARVVHVDADGNRRVLAELPAGSPGAPGLPPSQIFNGIAMDADGNLFITGEASRVLYRIRAPW